MICSLQIFENPFECFSIVLQNLFESDLESFHLSDRTSSGDETRMKNQKKLKQTQESLFSAT